MSRPTVVLAALPPVAVLALDPGGLAPFGPAKWLAVTTLVLGAAAIVAFDRPMRVARRPMVAWAAFLAVVVVAAAVGRDPVYAWIGTPERHLGVVAWVLAALAFAAASSTTEDEGRRVAVGAAVAVGLAGAWAAAEALGWRPLHLVGAGARPVATLGSSAYLGAAAALLTPVAAGLAADARTGRVVRRLAVAAAGLGAVALVVSGARAAWVGAAVAALAVAVARRPGRRALVAAAGALAVTVVVAVLSGVAGRVPDVLGDRDGGAHGRLDEWRVAARVVAHHPVLGVGPEGYRLAFGRAVDDRYEQVHGRGQLPDRAHDALLDVAATTGIPGLLAYAGLLVVTGALVLRGLRRDPWLVGLAAGLLAYAVQSLFLFPLAELDPVAWLLAGVLVARVTTTAEVRLPAVVPAIGAGLAVVALVAGSLDVVADRRARAALDATAVVADPAGAARLRPDAVRYRLVAARGFAATDSSIGLDRAIDQLDHALAVSPRDPVAAGERARLLLERARRSGDPAHARTARRALEALAADDPRNPTVLLRLGIARAATGDAAGAERAWLAAERLAPRSAAASTDLALAYERAGRTAEAGAAAARALARHATGPQVARLRRLAGTG